MFGGRQLNCILAVLIMIDGARMVHPIVHGTKANPKEFPHMAVIGFGTSYDSVQWLCAGSLISEKFVLSVASCQSHGTSAKWVLLGDLDTSTNTDGAKPKVYEIVKQFNHPNYKKNNLYDDITLLQLNASVKFNDFIKPVCLHTSPTIPITVKKVIATGWGTTGSGELQSTHLLKTTLDIEPDSKCVVEYDNLPTMLNRGYDTKSMICAGDSVYGNDTCQGDSGGPLHLPMNTESCPWTQVGITSFGSAFCDGHSPGVYTKVANYIDWIRQIV